VALDALEFAASVNPFSLDRIALGLSQFEPFVAEFVAQNPSVLFELPCRIDGLDQISAGIHFSQCGFQLPRGRGIDRDTLEGSQQARRAVFST